MLLIILAPTLLVAQTNGSTYDRSIVFSRVTVIDVTGAPSKSDMTVVVKGSRIADVEDAAKSP